jgi:hypothetical protein
LKKLTAAVLVLMIATLFGCSQGDKTVTLTFKFTPGQVLKYEQNSRRSFKVWEADSLVDQGQTDYLVEVTDEVLEIDDEGIADVRENAVWSYTMPNKEDSDKIDSVRFEREMVIRLRSNGKLEDIEAGPEIKAASIAYIKNYYKQGMPTFPSGEHAPGYSWTQSTSVVTNEETVEASTSYKIKSIAREAGYDCAVIEFEGNLVIPIQPNPSDSVLRSGVDKVTTTGVMYFAYREGIVVSQRERWVIDGDRETIREGKTKKSRIEAEIDVDFQLKSRGES